VDKTHITICLSSQPTKKVGGCYTIDEKMARAYVHEDLANTLAARDYKQPQTLVIVGNYDGRCKN
jgi:hypothetical protein